MRAASRRSKAAVCVATVLDPAMDHLLGGKATRTMAFSINDNHAAAPVHFLGQVLHPVNDCLFGIGLGTLDVIGNGLGQDRAHKILTVTGTGYGTTGIIREHTRTDNWGIAHPAGMLVDNTAG